MEKNIYVVSSFTDTVPGKLIRARATLKFWNRYPGDYFSHVSLCKDKKLGDMMSFARKEIKNPFNSGLIKENIREGLFKINSDKSIIAVMKLKVSDEQYVKLCEVMNRYWELRDTYKFNYLGLINMLLFGRGINRKNHFFCSQWVDTVLKEIGVDLFDGIPSYNIRPFDFYNALRNNIIYEGNIQDYLSNFLGENCENNLNNHDLSIHNKVKYKYYMKRV